MVFDRQTRISTFLVYLIVAITGTAIHAGASPSSPAVLEGSRLADKQSLQRQTKEGDLLEGFRPIGFAEETCGEALTAPSGNFASPNYPEDYPNDVACTWEITATPGSRIRVTFTEFHLEASINCTKDYIEIYNGENYQVFCGRDVPQSVESVGNGLSLVLVTDEAINLGNRFAAVYTTFGLETTTEEVLVDVPCEHEDDVSYTENYGFFKSPHHPQVYPKCTNCTYTIRRSNFQAGEGCPTIIAFLRFRTYSASGNDNTTVSFGPDGSQSLSGNLQTAAGDFGSNLPVLSGLVATTTVTFTSDGDQGTDTGFLLAYARRIAPEADGPYCLSTNRAEKADARRKENVATVATKVASKRRMVDPWNVIHMNFSSGTVYSENPELSGLAHFGSSPLAEERVIDYGFIMTPGHPGNYPTGPAALQWELEVPRVQRLGFSLLRLALADGDTLVLVDEGTGMETWFSGYGEPGSVWLSKGNKVIATFFTESSSQRRTGFLAAIAAVDII